MGATGRNPLNLEIEVGPLTGDRFVDAYVGGEPGIEPLFPASPFDPASYHAKSAEVRTRFPPQALGTMASAVRTLSTAASERLARIAAGDGYFVTTGQQPGLFGGPLYTVSKTLTAIALARRLEEIVKAPVLALFWLASDDHDWDEANHVHVLDTRNELRRLELRGDPEPPRSMGQRRLGDGYETALAELIQSLPPSDFTPDVIARIHEAYRAEATVAGAFAATLASLFDGLALGLVDSQDAVIRELARPTIRRALADVAAQERGLVEQTAKLEAAGHEAQVQIIPGASNVFYEDEDHGRERLLRQDGGWVLRASGRRLQDGEVEALLEREPSRFSPNVVLRPVVESAVLPTLAYIAGPGEVRYLAQTRLLFDAHGVGMPLVFPRLSVLLVEAKVRKVLDKFGLEPSSFLRPVGELVAAAVREEVPAEVQESLGRLRAAVQAGYGELEKVARSVDPTLKSPIFGARADALRSLAEVEKKIRQHVKLGRQTELDQIEKAAVNLAPMGRPQERVLNVHQYLARYGPELLDAILERAHAGIDSLLADAAAPAVSAGPASSSGDLE
jgi:bacillithiol synthase